MKIAVILVNYNGENYNIPCIESIQKSESSEEIRIYFVDNHSTDNSVELLKNRQGQFPCVELICLDKNYGFAAANNAGIKAARKWEADYILLLNNDTEAEPLMLRNLVDCAKRHPASVIVPKIYYSDDRERIWWAGGSVSKVIKKVRHDGLNRADKGQYDIERTVQFATGCCLFMPISVIKRAGLLDERFFLYYEDVEYSFRLNKCGIEIYYCPAAHLYHKVGASSKGKESPLCAYYISRNWLSCNKLYLQKRFYLFLLYYMVNRTACCTVWLLRGRMDLVRAVILGVRDYTKGRTGYVPYFVDSCK